jgi:peptidoglycan/xylan/chitin deacetylase (PgdA/CDA1 family)
MMPRMSIATRLDAWLPTPLLKGSALLHLGAVASLARPQLWPWALGAVLADHLLLTACGLWPRSRVLGPNWTHLPAAAAARGAIAITIDDGPDPEVTPRVLALLAQSASSATFFCIGERVARYAELAREIVHQGHRIENHSQHHRHHFSVLGPRSLAREIAAAQETIERVTGTTPRFFRAPAGLRSPFLQPILTRLDLKLASWTRRGFDTVNHDAAAVSSRLRRGLAAGDILLLHDGHAARTAAGAPVIVEVLPALLAVCSSAGLKPVTLHSAL